MKINLTHGTLKESFQFRRSSYLGETAFHNVIVLRCQFSNLLSVQDTDQLRLGSSGPSWVVQTLHERNPGNQKVDDRVEVFQRRQRQVDQFFGQSFELVGLLRKVEHLPVGVAQVGGDPPSAFDVRLVRGRELLFVE